MRKALKWVGLFFVLVVLSAGVALIPIGQSKNLHKGLGDNQSKSGIIDNIDLLSSSEKKSIDRQIHSTAKELDMNILVLLNDRYLSESDMQDYAHNIYDEIFGEYTDGVLLLLDFSNKYDACDVISTSGRAHLRYQKVIEELFDSFYSNLPPSGSEVHSSNITAAVEDFCYGLEKLKHSTGAFTYYYDKTAYNPVYTYMRGNKVYVTESKPPAIRFKFALIGSIVGVLISLGLYFSIKSSYKFKGKTNAAVYVAQNERNYSEKSDTFIRQYTSKVRIESSSGGGGIGRVGGGHSGSHGGGTRHR